jgi:hypothetical protein
MLPTRSYNVGVSIRRTQAFHQNMLLKAKRVIFVPDLVNKVMDGVPMYVRIAFPQCSVVFFQE